MHIALWISGIGALVFAAFAAWVASRPVMGSDQSIGEAIGTLVLGGIAGAFGLTWLALVIIKAANA